MSENALRKALDSSNGTDKKTSACRECGTDLGAGYLCDKCDGAIAQVDE